MAFSFIDIIDGLAGHKNVKTDDDGTGKHSQAVVQVEVGGTATAVAAKLGALTEAAPTTYTGSSGLNGLLRRLSKVNQKGDECYRVVLAATENEALISSSARCAYQVFGFNAEEVRIAIDLYNKATAAILGTDTPLVTVYAQPGQPFDVSIGALEKFPLGLAVSVGLVSGTAGALTTAQGSILQVRWST